MKMRNLVAFLAKEIINYHIESTWPGTPSFILYYSLDFCVLSTLRRLLTTYVECALVAYVGSLISMFLDFINE